MPEYNTYRTDRNTLLVHESRDMCICKWGAGVGDLVGKGVRKGSRDEYIGKSGLGVGSLGLVGVGGLGVGGSGVGGSGVGGLFCRESEATL